MLKKFKLADTKFIKIFKTGKLPKNDPYSEFYKIIKQKHNIDIAFCDIYIGELQSSIRMYINSCDNDILNVILQNRIGYHINQNKFPLFMQETAEKIINEYYEFYRKERISETILYAYIFKDSIISAAYGHSVAEIKKKLLKKYKEYSLKICIPYEPRFVVMFQFPSKYELAKTNGIFEEIKSNSFKILKKYDKFNFITLKNFNIDILNEKDVSQAELSCYAREW